VPELPVSERTQTASGALPSVPDSIGPRPYAISVPALADAVGLRALGYLSRRIALAHRMSRQLANCEQLTWIIAGTHRPVAHNGRLLTDGGVAQDSPGE
jgi:hypothetical protein